jgi:hypothetical protein
VLPLGQVLRVPLCAVERFRLHHSPRSLQRPWRDGVFELTDCIGYATPDGIVAGGREDVHVIGTLSACVVSLSLEHQMAARQISISGITSDQRRSRFHLRFRPRAVLDIDGAQSHVPNPMVEPIRCASEDHREKHGLP